MSSVEHAGDNVGGTEATPREKKSAAAKSAGAPTAGRKDSQKDGSRFGQTLASEITYPVEVSVRTLLEAGAHFGHQTQKWNPKMLPHIYCAKNGIHILNLDGTLAQWTKARKFIVDTVGRGGSVLFVGTKIQARDVVQEEATRSGSYYVTTRWLGGTLSNFQTIKNSIERMRRLEELLTQSETEGSKVKITKKEKLVISREVGKLEQSLGGIRNMKKTPEIIFVIDVLKETIAVEEARRLRIPVVALVDTNADPDRVEYPIPSNDDAGRTIRLFAAAVGDAVIEGRAVFNARPPRERQEMLQVLEGRASQQQSTEARERSDRGGRDRGGERRGRHGGRDADRSGAGGQGAGAAQAAGLASASGAEGAVAEASAAEASAGPAAN